MPTLLFHPPIWLIYFREDQSVKYLLCFMRNVDLQAIAVGISNIIANFAKFVLFSFSLTSTGV